MSHLDYVADAVGWALVHSVWQGVAAGILLAIILRLLRGASSALRYGAACVCLGAVVTAFGVTFWIGLPEERALPIMRAVPVPMLIEAITLDASISNDPIVESPWTVERAMPWVVAAWLVGVIVLSLCQLGGWLLLGRYRRMAEPADSTWAGRLARVAKLIGVRRVTMVVTRVLDVPIVIGAFRPFILMPAAVLNNLPIPRIEAILAHELAHVRRYDYLVNLVQSAIETIFFYHPAVWWISKQIRREREFCCDDLAAKVCGDRAMYATALAALEESRGLRLAPAAGGGGRGELLERVKRILRDPSPARRRGRSRTWVAAALVLVACIGVGLWSRQLEAQPAPTTVPSASPSTRPVDAPAANSAIVPADMVASRDDYRLGPNDLVQVSITDLVGPGIETVKMARVSESGFISLPMIGQVKAAGLTDAQLEQEIARGYSDRNLIRNATVIAVVMEARNRTFSVYGAVRQLGQYAIVDNDFRLFNALVLARGTTANTDIRVFRPTDDPARPRIIEIPGAAVAAADPKVNIVIRPGDFIFVTQPARGSAAVMTPAEDAELQAILQRGVVSAQEAWDSLEQRSNGGEAMTPAFVQLQLDTAKRIYEAKVSASSAAALRVAAAEEYLKRCVTLSDNLARRLGQDVTRVQISQANAMVDAAKAELIRRKAEARQAVPQRTIRVLVNETQVLVDGKSTGWATIRKTVQEIPEVERSGVVIEIAAGSKATPVSRFFTAEREARLLSEELGLGAVQVAGVDPNATEKQTGSYVIGGNVPRNGVYELSSREITLRAAIIAAGGPQDGANVVDILRKIDGRSQVLLQNANLAEIMSGAAPDVVLQPDDEIMISTRPSPGAGRRGR